MERILNQDEIDALFERAQAKKAAAPARERVVTKCNFRQPGMSKDHIRQLSALHEGFARSVTSSVGAFLRVPFDVNLVSVEQVSYMEYLQRVPELTYLASLILRPSDITALMQLDLAVAFPIVDLLLGGKGSKFSDTRDLTEIEEHILETILNLLIRELQRAWESMQLEFELERRQQQTQVLHLMPPTERLLSVNYEIRMQEARGNLNFAIPATISSGLLRKLSEQWITQKRSGPSDATLRLREILADCPFGLELALPSCPVETRELLDLKPGSILPLSIPIQEPGVVLLEDTAMFTAEPIRNNRKRAAHVKKPLLTHVEARK